MWDGSEKAKSILTSRFGGGAERAWAGKLSLFPCAFCDSAFDEKIISMTTEQELRQKLAIFALFEGAPTAGDCPGPAAAIDRVRRALAAAEQIEKPVETYFKLVDQWNRRLFTALCRRYALKPYRYPRQHRTTVVLRAPKSFIDKTLWPEYLQIEKALHEYLNEATERIIREEVFGNSDEAEERAG
jgi:hypothetical protein